MGLVVLCDFDGTITDVDTCVLILEKFAKSDWKIYDEQFEKGEITLEDCLRKQFSTATATKAQIFEEVDRNVSIRPGFEDLVKYCTSHKIPLIIVSAGLDFVIEHILKKNGWQHSITICAPKARPTPQGIELSFPTVRYDASNNFKDDLVRFHKSRGSFVIYIGDGFADHEAGKNAQAAFAIENSKLANLLRSDGVPYREISNFLEVVKAIEAIDFKKRGNP